MIQKKVTISMEEKALMFELGYDEKGISQLEHWINRNDLVQINAPAALMACEAKGKYAIIQRLAATGRNETMCIRDIGRRLKKCRIKRNMTQEQVATILNCSQASYAFYENGQRAIPLDKLIRLAKLYNVSTDFLLGIRLRNSKEDFYASFD